MLSLKHFRSQLLAEEATLEQTHSASPFISAMMAQNQTFQGKALVLDEGNSNSQPQGYPSSSKSAPSSQISPGFNGVFNGYHGVFHGSIGGFNGPNAMFTNGGYFGSRGSHFKGRGRGCSHYQSGPRPYQVQPSSSPGILGHGIDIHTCQICSKKGLFEAFGERGRGGKQGRKCFFFPCLVCPGEEEDPQCRSKRHRLGLF